jgi:nickel-dependent lactate racemase
MTRMRGLRAYGAYPDERLKKDLADSIADIRYHLNKVLLIVPDHTRYHSNAGKIANILYHLLEKDTIKYSFDRLCHVDLLVALGTHVPMTNEQLTFMFGDIPRDRFTFHNWRTDVKKIGVVPAEFVKEVSEGVYDKPAELDKWFNVVVRWIKKNVPYQKYNHTARMSTGEIVESVRKEYFCESLRLIMEDKHSQVY